MAAFASGDYDLDYVYMPEGLSEFRNVHISLKIQEAGADLLLISQEDIAKADLQDIFTGLQNHTFKRIHIDIARDCVPYLIVGGTKRKVLFEDGSLKIKDCPEV